MKPTFAGFGLAVVLGLWATAADAGGIDAGVDAPEDAVTPPLAPTVGPEMTASTAGYGSTKVGGAPSLACGPSRCLAVWNDYSNGYAMPIDSSGQPLRRAALRLDGLPGRQAVAFIGGDFVVATYAGGDITLTRLSSDGTLVDSHTATVGSPVADLALAWNGAHLLVVFRAGTASGYTTSALLVGADLGTAGSPVALVTTTEGFGPIAVVATGSTFVVILAKQGFTLDDNGQLTVGPVSLGAPFDGPVALVAADTTAIAYGAGTLVKLGPDLQPTASASTQVSGNAPTLAWNGTNLLVAQGDGAGDTLYVARFGTDLGALDPSPATISASSATPTVSGQGSGFMLLEWKDGYAPEDYGVFSLPLNSAGRPRATSDTLISVVAMEAYNPRVVAQASGFVAVAGQGVFEMAVIPLGPDGRSVPGHDPAGIATYEFPVPIAIGTGPNGGMTLSGSRLDPRIMLVRFDTSGSAIDLVPHELDARFTLTRGNVVWNGNTFLWLFGPSITPLGSDGSFGTAVSFAPQTQPQYSAADAMGTTVVVLWLDTIPKPISNALQARTIRVGDDGGPIDATPNDVGEQFSAMGAGLALAHDGSQFLAVWDAATVETSGALTSDLRMIFLGGDGRASSATSTSLRRATGAVPASDSQPVPALSQPTVVFDGSVYWVAWREDSLWIRRVGSEGQVIDPAPIKLLDPPFVDFDMASRGDGTLMLLYNRYDSSDDVQSVRLMTRMVATGNGAGGMGGSGGAGGSGGQAEVGGGGGSAGSDGAASDGSGTGGSPSGGGSGGGAGGLGGSAGSGGGTGGGGASAGLGGSASGATGGAAGSLGAGSDGGPGRDAAGSSETGAGGSAGRDAPSESGGSAPCRRRAGQGRM